eukprot:5880620-Pyramimonas_sp.AAC.1
MRRPNDEHVTAPVEGTIDAVVKSVRDELQSDGGMGDPQYARKLVADTRHDSVDRALYRSRHVLV